MAPIPKVAPAGRFQSLKKFAPPGAPCGFVITLNDQVLFDFDKSDIRPDAANVLDTLAAALRKVPDVKLLEIRGHTDAKGSDDYNQDLSERRAQAVLAALRQRGSGQVALVSSLAGYFGLPVTPSYSASKAGLKAYGEALRGWLAPEGIAVNVIMPGYVQSPMCDAMPGPKPFLWTPEQAARAILQGLARNKARISFPFPLNFGCWWLAVLPAGVSQRIVRWLGYGA